jgi:dienelactone hydrolase
MTDPATVATAVVEMARHGRFADIEQLFAPPLRAVVSAEVLRTGWESQGRVVAVGAPVSEPRQAGLVRVSVPVTCDSGGFTVAMSVDDTGVLHGLALTPTTAPWEPPPYARPDDFTEHEVTVGTGPLAVPGTMTLPDGGGPGVVLLTAGPFDRDLTTGPNKPFKDLAWGLASRGMAVLRFDKVNHVHPEVVRPGFTMTDEYVPHAVAAVRLLQQQPGVDRVFVLGHSGGGKAAPLVATTEPSIAGVIILAGDTVPLSQTVVRVGDYLAELDPSATEAVEALRRQAAVVEDPGLAETATDLLFGWPASYWLDLRDYDPVATAAALDKPMLILQGGRDYQVTTEDLAGWQAGLVHRPDVTFRVHDADDHLFFPGTGPSTPADYGSPQHVDVAVITDVATFVI